MASVVAVVATRTEISEPCVSAGGAGNRAVVGQHADTVVAELVGHGPDAQVVRVAVGERDDLAGTAGRQPFGGAGKPVSWTWLDVTWHLRGGEEASGGRQAPASGGTRHVSTAGVADRVAAAGGASGTASRHVRACPIASRASGRRIAAASMAPCVRRRGPASGWLRMCARSRCRRSSAAAASAAGQLGPHHVPYARPPRALPAGW